MTFNTNMIRFSFGVVSIAIFTLLPSLAIARNAQIRVTVGQSITESFVEIVRTVSIANSNVADVVVAGPNEVLVNGKQIGLTTLVVWDENNKSTIFDVIVRGPFSDQKIELRVQVAEVNRTEGADYGVDFYGKTNVDGDPLDGGLFAGSVAAPQLPLAAFAGQTVTGVTAAVRYLTGGSEIQTMIRAMITDGVLRVLAEPTVVAASGEKASFLAGGEIPVPIASAGGQGGTNITIDWKEFGIKIDFLPTIVDSGIINLSVSPSVSSLDRANGIRLSGFDIPAIRMRRASTTVELRDGELLVIGGLMMEEETSVVSRVPLLGSIPILGALFRKTTTLKHDTELLIVVSPNLVHAMSPGTPIALPTIEETK